MAAAGDPRGFVRLLIARDVDINTARPYYSTALQAACCFRHSEVVRELLEAGANTNVAGRRYNMPLQAAVLKGGVGIVNLLLEHHADADPSQW